MPVLTIIRHLINQQWSIKHELLAHDDPLNFIKLYIFHATKIKGPNMFSKIL